MKPEAKQVSLACQKRPSGEKADILVVDDDESIRQLLGQILEMKGYAFNLAADAARARKLLSGKYFDLVLCDINMPGESGLELAKF